MITVIFWNIDKQSKVLSHAPCLAKTHSVDIFLLAESPKNLTPALQSLDALGIGDYREEANATARIRALTRLGCSDLIHRFTGIGRLLAVWSIRSPRLQSEVLLAAVHLPSKAGGNNDADQLSVTKEVVNELSEIEDGRNHRNTVLAGDFNMHPYDSGMTSVTGVHGLMTRKLAEMPDRVHLGLARRRFYNPMWGLFGDRTPGPAGTHYWRSSVLHNPHWGMIDHVLLRPAMIDRLNDLAILESDGVPGLDGYRDRVLSVTYDCERFYPVTVDADIFTMPRSAKLKLELSSPPNGGQPKGPANVADSDQEFTNLVAKVLQSPQVVSLAQSLIARATEALAEKEQRSAADTDDNASNERRG